MILLYLFLGFFILIFIIYVILDTLSFFNQVSDVIDSVTVNDINLPINTVSGPISLSQVYTDLGFLASPTDLLATGTFVNTPTPFVNRNTITFENTTTTFDLSLQESSVEGIDNSYLTTISKIPAILANFFVQNFKNTPLREFGVPPQNKCDRGTLNQINVCGAVVGSIDFARVTLFGRDLGVVSYNVTDITGAGDAVFSIVPNSLAVHYNSDFTILTMNVSIQANVDIHINTDVSGSVGGAPFSRSGSVRLEDTVIILDIAIELIPALAIIRQVYVTPNARRILPRSSAFIQPPSFEIDIGSLDYTFGLSPVVKDAINSKLGDDIKSTIRNKVGPLLASYMVGGLNSINQILANFISENSLIDKNGDVRVLTPIETANLFISYIQRIGVSKDIVDTVTTYVHNNIELIGLFLAWNPVTYKCHLRVVRDPEQGNRVVTSPVSAVYSQLRDGAVIPMVFPNTGPFTKRVEGVVCKEKQFADCNATHSACVLTGSSGKYVWDPLSNNADQIDACVDTCINYKCAEDTNVCTPIQNCRLTLNTPGINCINDIFMDIDACNKGCPRYDFVNGICQPKIGGAFSTPTCGTGDPTGACVFTSESSVCYSVYPVPNDPRHGQPVKYSDCLDLYNNNRDSNGNIQQGVTIGFIPNKECDGQCGFTSQGTRCVNDPEPKRSCLPYLIPSGSSWDIGGNCIP